MLLDSLGSPSPSRTPPTRAEYQRHELHPSSSLLSPHLRQHGSSSSSDPPPASSPMRLPGGGPNGDTRTPPRPSSRPHANRAVGSPGRIGAAFTADDSITVDSTASVGDETAVSSYGDHWASPTEVMELRSLNHDIVKRYGMELQRLQAELDAVRQVCHKYEAEKEQLEALRQLYQSQKAACEAGRQQQAQWQEERELLRLQLQSMSVENQRLQLFIEKKRKSHRTFAYEPQMTQGRVRAAVSEVQAPTASLPPDARRRTPPPPPPPVPSSLSSWPQHPSSATSGAASSSLPHLSSIVTVDDMGGAAPFSLAEHPPVVSSVSEPTLFSSDRRPSTSQLSHDNVDHTRLPVVAGTSSSTSPATSTPQHQLGSNSLTTPSSTSSPTYMGHDGAAAPAISSTSTELAAAIDAAASPRPQDTHISSQATGQETSASSPSPFADAAGYEDDEGDGAEVDPSYARGATDVSSTSLSTDHPTASRSMQARLQHTLRGPPGMVSNTMTNATAASPSVRPYTSAPAPTTSLSSDATASSLWTASTILQLPHSPAEALKEEVRLVTEGTRLVEENGLLKAQLQHLIAIREMDTDQREQQMLRLANANETMRRRCERVESESQGFQTQVESLKGECTDLQHRLLDVVNQRQMQQQQERAALVTLEQETREWVTEAMRVSAEQLSALRRLLLSDATARIGTAVATEVAADMARNDAAMAEYQRQCETAQEQSFALRQEVGKLRDACAAAEQEKSMLQGHLEMKLQAADAALRAARISEMEAVAKAGNIEAELECLKETTEVREACMKAMEERLMSETQQLVALHERVDADGLWQARATAAEADIEVQKQLMEREVQICKTAMTEMQRSHLHAMEKAAKRYEKLIIRYEAVKLQLMASVSGTTVVDCKDAALRRQHRNAKGATVEEGVNAGHAAVAVQSGPPKPDGSTVVTENGAEIEVGEPQANQLRSSPPTASSTIAAPNSIVALQQSSAVADRLLRSIHRPS